MAKKTWTKVEGYNTTIVDLDERDCMYPLCLIEVEGCRACEHACPFEKQKLQDGALPK